MVQGTVPADFDAVHCSPLINLRKTQSVDTAKKPSPFAPARGKNFPGVFPKGTVGGAPSYGSPDAVKYPVYNLNLPVREQRPSPQLWNQTPEELVNLDGMFTGRGWVENSPIPQQGSPSETANLDTSMSDNNSEAHKSSGHTSSTTHSSSNTSYSSPHEESIDNIGPMSARHRSHDSTTTGLTPAGSTPGMFSFGTPDEMQYPIRASPRMQNSAGINNDSQAWQLGSSSNELPNGLTGSSPSSTDAAWVQLLDGVLWDNSQAGLTNNHNNNNTVQWTGQQGPIA